MADSAALQQWPLDKFVEYASNPRRNDHAVAQAAAAIEQFGFRVPVLAKSDGLVIDGHLRLKAARKLGLAAVPVMLADDMSEAQVKAFRLSVNKIADLAEWDEDLLAAELEELRHMDFDLASIGFAPGELNDLIGEQNTGADPDEVPEAPADPVSRAGDLWIMGAHRLICGDATSKTDVARLLQGGGKAAPDGHRPAVWRRVRCILAGSCRRQSERREARQGGERRPGGLERGVGALSW